MSTVISIEDVSKLYRLGEIGTGSLAHDVNRWWHKVRGNEDPYLKLGQSNDRSTKGDSDYVYAIQNVSFEVKQGEVLGIIGRNGAGKSTLLKVLSRVTTPTSGQIKVKGRIASLLEVGTGFHPELTGKENIFLNGAILGMRKAEIRSKFDEIVDFSGCERYIDTPVKRYSSGMYVRLAFAVAAHLEPEILIVDEVLAVGDAEFQKKCIGKMKDVAGQGRTVLFVSHNMAAVTSLTNRCIILVNGKVQYAGATSDCVQEYLSNDQDSPGHYEAPSSKRDGAFVGGITIRSGDSDASHASGDEICITFEIRHSEPIVGACFSFQIVNQQQQPVIHCWIYDVDTPICRDSGLTMLKCTIPKLSLNIGNYSLNTYLSEPPGGRMFEALEGVCGFEVEVLGQQTLFGWRADSCAYLEEFKWEKI